MNKQTKKTEPVTTRTDAKEKTPTAVVGIGASAGGLEAIEAFFQAMPTDSGMAFVVIQHLSPHHKSLMVELLSRKTTIPVRRAEDGMPMERDHIYLIQPKENLTIFHGKLLLHKQKPRGEINLPVDMFFRSLAEDQGEKAVAVVLSGTGSDGTRGVRAIKEWGGLVMVQDVDSAKFDGMPRAATSTGLADFVLAPEQMPPQLLACLRHPYASQERHQREALSQETGMTRLFSLLRAKTKVDFTFYKPTTIMRRIERRIAVSQVEDLDAYVRYTEENPGELNALYRELLIGVTSFFRDPQIMQSLREQALPDLFERFPGRELRFWVAGCSTGEEAYTLAILAREVMEERGLAQDIKIFATDIDRDAVLKAGEGIYPESIAADLDPGLLAKYFYCRGETYQVARHIREMIVFAQHNLLKDPPFTRIDLVSCRNLLIYLQTNLQQHALSMFDFSLNPGGVLLLGSSETTGDMEDHFQHLDRKARIYQARDRTKGGHTATIPDHAKEERATGPLTVESPRATRAGREERTLLRILDALSDAYVPLAVVVDENLEVRHSVGDTAGIFKLPSGRAVYDISKMVDRELAIPLATGIQKVFREGNELAYNNLRLRDGDTRRQLRLRMRLLPGRKAEQPLAIIFFEEIVALPAETGDDAVVYDMDEETSQRLQDLEQELQFTRENLQATIEELETSNEELQATNEELLASNEELQSTNEELQSTNEELYTVNSEYQNKIIELTEVQNDVDNLLSSSRIGTLILDEDLCVRRFSPNTANVFHLVDGDIGRPLNHLTHVLCDFDPALTAEQVQREGTIREVEVQSENGDWFLVRTLPYCVGPDSYAGVVITLIDISSRRQTRGELEHWRQTATDIVEHTPSGLFVYEVSEEGELHLRSGNPAATQITGLDINANQGKRFEDLWPGEQGARIREQFLEAYRSGEAAHIAEAFYSDEQLQGIYHIHAFRLQGKRLAVGFEDISERKRAEAALKQSEEHHRHLYCLLADAEKTARMGSWTWDIVNDTVTWSENLYQLLGRDPARGAPSFAEHDPVYTPESMARLREAVQATLEHGRPYELKLDAVRADTSIMPCIARGQAEHDEAGAVWRLYGSLQEVSE